MFHVDMTFEDCRIIAESDNGSYYRLKTHDLLTGESSPAIVVSAKQLGYIFAFNMDSNGEPEGFEKMYAELEPLLVGIPNNLRPIP